MANKPHRKSKLPSNRGHRVTAVNRKLNDHGATSIQVTCVDGSTIDVAIDLTAAQTLVEVLQRQLVRQAHKSTKNFRVPELDVSQVDVAHKGPLAQLMVTTSQIGALVLRMPDEVLRMAQQEIGQVMTYRSVTQTNSDI